MKNSRLVVLVSALALMSAFVLAACSSDDSSSDSSNAAGFELATTIPTGELYGLAMNKDSANLLEAVNGAIGTMKADGSLNDIYQKWFQIDAPAGVTDNDTSSGGDAPDFSSELITDGTLTVGSDIPFPPFEFGKAPDYDGFDIDLVNKIADELGLEVVIKDTSFDTIFTDVAAGKFDLVASASTITPEREQTVNFSDPYYEAEQALLVPVGSDIASVEDLDGLTVGAQDGTTGEAYANDETNAGEVRGFPNGPAAIAALENGQVEATIIDQPVAQDAIDKAEGSGSGS